MTEYPLSTDQIIYRHDAIASGYTDKHLARDCRSGTLTRIWQGAYLLSDTTRTPDDTHRLTAIAAATISGDTLAISHHSAAWLHELSVLGRPPTRVHLTTIDAAAGKIDGRRHVHPGPVTATDLTVVNDVTVVSIELAAVQSACAATGFAQALSIFDSALHHHADLARMSELLERPLKGVGLARYALSHANGLAANAGESWSRAQMIAAGLPTPRLQHRFYSPAGIFIAMTDCDWEGRLAGEFDGKVKYLAPFNGRTANQVLYEEKLREDALRDIGVSMVRWSHEDLVKNQMVPRVRARLAKLGLI